MCKILLHICDTYNCDYLQHTSFCFYLIDFQLNTYLTSQFSIFIVKSPSLTQRLVSQALEQLYNFKLVGHSVCDLLIEQYLHVLINNSRTAWPTKIYAFLSVSPTILDNHIFQEMLIVLKKCTKHTQFSVVV